MVVVVIALLPVPSKDLGRMIWYDRRGGGGTNNRLTKPRKSPSPLSSGLDGGGEVPWGGWVDERGGSYRMYV